MDINLVEILENLTDSSRDTKESLVDGDKIKVSYKGSVITTNYNMPEQEGHQDNDPVTE